MTDARLRSSAYSLMVPVASAGVVGILLGIALSRPPSSLASSTAPPPKSQRLAPPVAQLPTRPAPATVTIGNERLPIPWQRRGDRIGIADIPLMTHLGVDLQNTTVVDQQPITWFAETPEPVAVWHADGYRYLDLTEWAARRGWQFIPDGENLQIRTVPGTLLASRRGRQEWGDRLVLEVDRPVVWSLEEELTSFTLTIQASPGSRFDPTPLTAGNGNVLDTLQVSVDNGQLKLRGSFDETARPRVWSLTNPHRIVIDISQVDVVPRDILWAPGLRWRQEYRSVGDRAFPVHQLWLSPEIGTRMQPIWSNPDQLPGLAPLSTMAKTWGASAAINAGFFNRNNQLPLGAIRSNSEWISGPILNRGAIAWNNQGNAVISPLLLAYSLTTVRGESFPIAHVNSGYVQAGIGLYTPAWGSTYTPITDGETIVTVAQEQITQQTIAGAADTGAYAIPEQGYLLALRASNTAAAALSPGTSLTLNPDLRPSEFATLPFAAGGGPVLVRDGRINADAKAEGFSDAFAAQAAPRSAIAVMPNGTLVLVAIHYSPGGRGPTLREAAQIMQQLGAQNALNLDGGSSSTLYLGGSVINRYKGTVGRVHNGLGIFAAPTPAD